MSKSEELLDSLDDAREQLLLAIEPLPDDAFLLGGAVGEWSVADVLANVTAWEAELVTGMMRLKQNKRPAKLLDALNDPTVFDRLRFEENQNRHLDQVFVDLQQVRIKVEDWLSEFSTRDLTNSKRYRWFRGRPFSEIIAAATYMRENNFVLQLKDFARQWQYEQDDPGTEVILLETIELSTKETNHEDTN